MPRTSSKVSRQKSRRLFDTVLADTGDYREACRIAGVSERTGRRWRDQSLSTIEARRALPPPPTTSFEGREEELKRLEERFHRGARLITVLGPAGIGKTRFAMRFMELLAPEPGRGEPIFCDLRHAQTEEALVTEIGHRLGVRMDSGTGTEVATIGRVLAARGPCLVVLDNFEHLAGACANVVSSWLSAAPEASLLVTSRAVLRLKEESPFELGPLPTPDEGPGDADSIWEENAAVRLFWSRALDAEPALERSAVCAEDVADLVRHLEGIPLALELAAAQMRRTSVVELLAEVDTRSLEFRSPHRDADSHHATLEAAIDQSWRLLSESERHTFAQLSVFRNGFSLHSATAVVRLPGTVPTTPSETIASLREASLLRVDGQHSQSRRWDLYEAIRAFGLERLRALGLEEATRSRHATYFLEEGERQAEALASARGAAARRWLADELKNLRSAFEHWGKVGSTSDQELLRLAWVLQNALTSWLPRVAVEIASRALETVGRDAVATLAEVRVYVSRAAALRELGSSKDADADVRRARQRLRQASKLGEVDEATAVRLEGEIGYEAAMLSFYEGQVSDAERGLREILARIEGAGYNRVEGRLHSALAWVLAEGLRSPEAFVHHPAAVELLERSGDEYQASVARRTWAAHRVFFKRGDARRDLAREANLLERLGGPKEEGYALAVLATDELDRGNVDRALDYGEKTARIAQRLGHRRLLGMAALARGPAKDEAANAQAASVIYEDALSTVASIGDRRTEALLAIYLGGTMARTGRSAEAEACFARATALIEGTGDRRLPAMLELQRGHLDLAEAKAALREGHLGRGLVLDGEARKRLETVRRRPEAEPGWPPLVDCDVEARHLVRVLERELARSGAQSWVVYVALDGSGFRVDSGPFRPIPPGKVIRRVFVALARNHIEAPGQLLATDQVLAIGWPGERMQGDTGLRRVRDVMLRLRQAGLEHVILTGGKGGYFVEPRLSIRFVDPPESPVARKT